MSSNHPDFADDAPMSLAPAEITAAEWLLQHERGMTAAQEKEFERWLRSDPRHAALLAQLQQTWSLIDRVPATSVPLPGRRAATMKRFSYFFAAAAAIALACWVGQPLLERSRLARQIVTATGELEKTSLPDGSVVRLNTESAVEIAFTPVERRVRLTRGQASFVVAKDPARPFVVRIGKVEVRAVGTAFAIHLRQDALEVLVSEGKVRVDNAVNGASLLAGENGPVPANDTARAKLDGPVLSAGQRATIPRTTLEAPGPQVAVAVVAPEEVARALAWQNRRLEFSGEPLGKVVAEFNRYNRHKLVIADPELEAQRFGGKFPTDDYQAFVQLLERNFSVSAERREDRTILRMAH